MMRTLGFADLFVVRIEARLFFASWRRASAAQARKYKPAAYLVTFFLHD